MTVSRSEPGVVVSGLAHVALLAATLVAFADTRRFDDAAEAVPIEMITETQLNQIMKGDKAAKEVKPLPVTRAEAKDEVVVQKPTPPTPEARRDTPTPPPPLKRQPDPDEDDEPRKPAPARVAALPPPRPEPEKTSEPKKPEPEPLKEAEPVPAPPKKPPEPKKEEAKKDEPKKEEPKPAPPVKPRPAEKPKFDEVARLLDEKKRDEAKPAAKPKSGDEQSEPQRKFSATDISKLLTRETAQQTPATAREPARTASLGTPTASAAKMSPSLWGQLDGFLQDQYKRCWNNNGLDGAQRYIAQIRVVYNADGSLAAQPVLVNPPSDPTARSLADSALRAVRICNPLRIPPQFAPFHSQWRARTLRFDPDELS